jgi:hypothetical protein
MSKIKLSHGASIIKSEKEIWFDAKRAWSKSRKASEKLANVKKKVSFIKYDENGKVCAYEFED